MDEIIYTIIFICVIICVLIIPLYYATCSIYGFEPRFYKWLKGVCQKLNSVRKGYFRPAWEIFLLLVVMMVFKKIVLPKIWTKPISNKDSYETSTYEISKKSYKLSWQSECLYITMTDLLYFNDIGEFLRREFDHEELTEDIYQTLKKSDRSGDVHIYVIFTYLERDKGGKWSRKRKPAKHVVTIQMSEVPKYEDSDSFEKNYKILDSIYATMPN